MGRMRLCYLVLALVALGAGTALAADPPPTAPPTSTTNLGRLVAYVVGLTSGQNIINLAWDNIVVPIGKYLSGPLTLVGVSLFFLALLYRIYNLLTLEVSPGALLYSVLRFFFLALALTMSNYQTYSVFRANPPGGGDPTYVLSGGQGCTHFAMVFSHMALCGWVRAYKEGYTRFIDNNQAQARMTEAITKFVSALLMTNALFKVFDVMKLSKAVATAIKAEKSITDAEEVATLGTRVKESVSATKQTNTGLKGRLLQIYQGLLPLVYFFLVVPVLIFLALLYISGAFVVIGAAFLPIAIALIGFGLTAPVIRVASMLFAQMVLAYLLPLFVFIGVIFAIERPAAALEGTVLTIADQVNLMIRDFMGKNEQVENQPLSSPNAPQPDPQDPAQKPKNFLERAWDYVSGPLLEALLRLGVILLMVFTFFFLVLPIFLMMVGFAYSIAVYLLWNLPGTVISLIGGGGGVGGGPGERMTPSVRGYRF